MDLTLERRRGIERRARERRARLAAIETEHDDLRRTVQQTSEFVQRLEAQQQTQLIRIAQIQMEIELLNRALRERGIRVRQAHPPPGVATPPTEFRRSPSSRGPPPPGAE